MVGNRAGYWRYRFGDYRVIARIEDGRLVIVVVIVGHRRGRLGRMGHVLKRSFATGLLALTASCSNLADGDSSSTLASTSVEQDQEDIVRAALAYAAATVPSYVDRMCMDGLLSRSGLDEKRESLQRFGRFEVSYAGDKETFKIVWSGQGMGWVEPYIVGNRYHELSPQAEAVIALHVATILARDESVLPVRYRIPRNWVPEPLSYRLNDDRPNVACDGFISMTAPAIDGNYAFIERSFFDGGRIAEGSALALRREPSGWRVIAMAHTWMS